VADGIGSTFQVRLNNSLNWVNFALARASCLVAITSARYHAAVIFCRIYWSLSIGKQMSPNKRGVSVDKLLLQNKHRPEVEDEIAVFGNSGYVS
jgi:hypothetical protein